MSLAVAASNLGSYSDGRSAGINRHPVALHLLVVQLISFYTAYAASDRQPAVTRLLACRLRIGNRILDELKSAETQCLENRIHLDWHSTTTLQGQRRSPDGLWAISHADGEGTGSRCLHRQGADNGGSREQYCTWLYVSTPPTPQRQAVANPRQPARFLPQNLLLVVSTTATVSYSVSRKEKFSDFKWYRTLQRDSLLVRESIYPCHPNPT